jgi:hypothetical protein
LSTHRRLLRTIDGNTIGVDLPAPSPRPSFFAFSPFKAGSTLLHNMLTEYCRRRGVPVVDIPSAVFQAGVRVQTITPESMDSVLEETGYGYVGWRTPLYRVKFDFARTRNVLLVRDPRDRIVSMYFSWAYSHVVPEAGEARDYVTTLRESLLRFGDVSRWVLGDPSAVRMVVAPLGRLHVMLPATTTRLYRYEDVIYRKPEWLKDMLAFFGVEVDQDLVDEVAETHDLRPETEDRGQHVRQVAPGNYKKHLSEDAIAYLNDVCDEYIQAYGYDDEASFARKLVYAEQGEEARSVLRPFRKVAELVARPDPASPGEG